jgi:hypothetical protein
MQIVRPDCADSGRRVASGVLIVDVRPFSTSLPRPPSDPAARWSEPGIEDMVSIVGRGADNAAVQKGDTATSRAKDS